MHGYAGARHHRRQPVANTIINDFQRLGRRAVGGDLAEHAVGLGARRFGTEGEAGEVTRHHALDMRSGGNGF